MTKITYIPGEIANAAIDEHGNRKPVTRTHHIFDDAKDKNQAEVNAEVDDTFAFHQSEINALNSQNYVTVDSFSSLPATGAVDTVYRVSSWDGTQQDPTVYSEYAWNGSQYVHLSTKTQIGEVFDISAYHATGGELAEYADLAAALGTNGANVPEPLRKGGMSIKFVQSSDHKYVQHRLIADEFTTDITQWAISDEGVYVDNPEFVRVVLDNEGKILEAIRVDGTKMLPAGVDIHEKINFEGNEATVIENPEFVYVKTDAEGKILWAIKTDGGIYYGAGVPQQVKDYIEEKISPLSTLKIMIDSINERIPELIENPEFLEVTEDANGRVLNGVRKDGVKVEYCDVIYPNGIPSQIGQHLPKSIKESEPVSFGSNYSGNSLTLSNPSYIIALNNVYSDIKGWLKTIRFYTNTSGTKTFHIGYIDQRSTAIIRLSFNCDAIAGFNEVDISEKHIIIEENETLFINARDIEFDVLSSNDNYPQMLSGQSNGVLERYDSEYGASLYLSWDIVEVSSLYSFKADTDTIEENVGSLSSYVNTLEKNINKVYDNNGNAYKLKIVNGELTPILQQFGNVLVIGNSVTRHPYNDSPGTRWLTSNRGMASTIIDNDYCHLLRDGLRVKVPQAQVTTCDGYRWERNLPTDKNTLRAYLEDYSGPYDLVVFALSENITSTDSNLIYNSCKAFFEVILEKWTDTTVLVTSTRMCIGESPNSPYGYKDIAIQKAARAMKFDYVDVRQRDYDAFVTNFNTGAWIPIYMNGDNGKFVAQNTVHIHPCDIGMLRIANDILVAIDCQPLENKIFQIAISCSQDYYAPTYWLENGLVTVICYEEAPQVVTVTDSDGNNIPFEIKDMTIEVIDVTPSKSPIAGIVFTMPSSNVIISIN